MIQESQAMYTKHSITGAELGKIVDAILDRMDLPLRPYQRSEIRTFLVRKLWWEWEAETLEAVRKAVGA